jgi:hypothetical protein
MLQRSSLNTSPGWYFQGLSWLYQFKADLLFGVGEDAYSLASAIAERRVERGGTAFSRSRAVNSVGKRVLARPGVLQQELAWDRRWREGLLRCHHPSLGPHGGKGLLAKQGAGGSHRMFIVSTENRGKGVSHSFA